MAKKPKFKVHVNRMGKDGAHLMMKVDDDNIGSFSMDLKYMDMPEDVIDDLVAIGEEYQREVLDLQWNALSDVDEYERMCGEALHKVMGTLTRIA